MGNTAEIPFTEIVERVKKLARSSDNTYEKIRGIVNDVYTREMGAKFDWNFLYTSSGVTTVAEAHGGNITMNTGDTAVILSSGTFQPNVAGYQIKFSGNDTVYDVIAYNNSTSVTINPALMGPQNLSGASYSLYQSRYPLAPNFDRFPKPGGVYRWAGGKKQILAELQYANYVNDFYQSTATTPSNTRLIGTDSTGCQMFEFVPAPRLASVYGYDYLRTVAPMWESTGGNITSINSMGTTVQASGANFTKALTDGSCFFRVDNLGKGADSTWYRILSVQNDNQLTLATVFASTGVTVANYTIAKSPEYPTRLHLGIVWGACRQMTIDQDDPNAQFYHSQYATVMSDGKKIYVSRPYSQDVTGAFEDYRYRR